MANHRTGGEIDAFCNKCKLLLAHTIIAMVGEKVVRVQCNTCESQHAYRGAAAATPKVRTATAAKAAPKAPGTAAVSRISVSFEQLLAEKDKSSARRYSPRDTYAQDEVIDHPSFGYGIVMDVRGDKVTVLFKMDEKTLVHGRGGAPAQKPSFHTARAHHTGSADKPPSESEVSAAAISESPENNADEGFGEMRAARGQQA